MGIFSRFTSPKKTTVTPQNLQHTDEQGEDNELSEILLSIFNATNAEPPTAFKLLNDQCRVYYDAFCEKAHPLNAEQKKYATDFVGDRIYNTAIVGYCLSHALKYQTNRLLYISKETSIRGLLLKSKDLMEAVANGNDAALQLLRPLYEERVERVLVKFLKEIHEGSEYYQQLTPETYSYLVQGVLREMLYSGVLMAGAEIQLAIENGVEGTRIGSPSVERLFIELYNKNPKDESLYSAEAALMRMASAKELSHRGPYSLCTLEEKTVIADVLHSCVSAGYWMSCAYWRIQSKTPRVLRQIDLEEFQRHLAGLTSALITKLRKNSYRLPVPLPLRSTLDDVIISRSKDIIAQTHSFKQWKESQEELQNSISQSLNSAVTQGYAIGETEQLYR